MRARNEQAQATQSAWYDARAAAQNGWAAENAFGTSNAYAQDASMQYNAAANARMAQGTGHSDDSGGRPTTPFT